MHRLEGAAAVEGFQHAGEDESGQPHREGHHRLAEGTQLVTEVGLRVKMCVWLGVSRGLDLAFLNAD